MADFTVTSGDRFWNALVRTMVLLPVWALLAYVVGAHWYSVSHTMAENARNARLPAAEIQYRWSNSEDYDQREWFCIVAAATILYGVGWSRLGGWLAALQLVLLLALCGVILGLSIDGRPLGPLADPIQRSHPGFEPKLPYAVQAGVVSAVVIALGLALLSRGVPPRPLTLRTILLAVLMMATFLGSVRAWVQWRDAEELRRSQEYADSVLKSGTTTDD